VSSTPTASAGESLLLGSNSRRLLDPEHGENVKVNKHSDHNKCIGLSPIGESPGGLFIGVVRRSRDNV
jgi:hypothetical protein